MREAERLSALIGDVYDAALDPSLWPDIVATVGRFVGGPAAALFSKDVTTQSGTVAYGHGIEPYYQRLYFEHYIKLDPATTGQFFAEIGEPFATADLLSYEEFLETRFYKEWARPQRLVDFVGAVLDKSTTSAALFGVLRHEDDGLVDDETRPRMRLVVPHIRRSVLIGKVFNLKAAEAATLAEALDGLAAGVLLVDTHGRIVHANAAGQAILAARDVLHSSRGRLAASNGN